MKKKDTSRIIITSIYLLLSFVLIGVILYKYISTRDISNVSLETTLLLGLSIAYIFYRIVKDKDFIPTAMSGNKLPIGKNKSDKNVRIKNYIKESLIFSIVIVCLDLCAILILKDIDSLIIFKGVTKTLNIILNSLITFIICLLISFGLEYFIGEISVKKILKKK